MVPTWTPPAGFTAAPGLLLLSSFTDMEASQFRFDWYFGTDTVLLQGVCSVNCRMLSCFDSGDAKSIRPRPQT